jgi:ATP-dependent helicase HrpB
MNEAKTMLPNELPDHFSNRKDDEHVQKHQAARFIPANLFVLSHPMPRIEPLPIDSVAEDIRAILRSSNSVILSAEPGAGKTTRVPLILLTEPWLIGKKIVMLEPRRLAARRAAEYMAEQLGEPVGATVGYRIRGESRTSDRTRVEVVTEGILTRMLQANAELPGVGLLIFDEFHERSIHADLGLALALDAQSHVRNDLRVLVMSATLDGVGLRAVLPNALTITSSGRQFPVETIYSPFRSEKKIEVRVAEAIERALRNHDGDVLAFLPGRREILRVGELLTESLEDESVIVHQLYGEADRALQNAALAPAPNGIRKAILATNVAETSLTIEGVRVVVDSGLARVAQFNPRRGMSGLVTTSISRASADQRRGRAGRQAPGTCYRLWTEADHSSFTEFSTPEIKSSDLALLALDLALWGAPLGEGLRFIDPPSTAHISQARNLLTHLGALDTSGNLTPHGRALHALPTHPRLAQMILRAADWNVPAQACTLAALLEERDPLAASGRNDADIQSRLDAVETGVKIDRGTRDRLIRQSESLMKMIGMRSRKGNSKTRLHSGLPLLKGGGEKPRTGLLLALAYPDRIAKRRTNSSNRYLLRNGTTAFLVEPDPLTRSEFIAVAEVDDRQTEARIFLAGAISEKELREEFSDQIRIQEEVRWDAELQSVMARSVERLDAIELSAKTITSEGEQFVEAMLEGIRSLGLECLPWTKEARAFCGRVEWLRTNVSELGSWPAFDGESLKSSISEWIAPFLDGIRRADQLKAINLESTLKARLMFEQQRTLDRLAPSNIQLPSGTRAPIEYESGSDPVLSVRLQEMFGQTETPTVGGGTPLLVHLLSPANRPLAVTKDLHSFWTKVYPALVKQLRMKYPKHVWPEDPLNATPTNKTKRGTLLRS